MSGKNFSLIMEFIDESPEFVNGFECGTIWQQLKFKTRINKQPVHLENSAQIQMMCDTVGAKCDIQRADAEWAYLTVTYPKI